MARGVTLTRLLDETRAEARLSLNAAHNNQTRDSHILLLQREQQRLWEDFAWPHLRVERFIPIQKGQRYYDPAGAVNAAGSVTTDLSIDRIENIEFKSDGEWLPVRYGINAGHYAAHDSDLLAESWPVMAWEVSEEDQIEVWPIADTDATAADLNGYLRLTGIRNLQSLVEDDDRADLDSRLLSLYAAGNILAASGAKDANIKLEAANRHYAKLKGAQIKTKSFRMFGIGEDRSPRRPVVTRYRPAS